MIKIKRLSRILTVLSFMLGAVLVFLGLYIKSVNSLTAPINFNASSEQGIALKSIKIENAMVETSVVKAEITDGNWQISESSANHLSSSSLPKRGGNIVIYGHNTDNIFDNLDTADIGDTIILTDVLGYQYAYRVDSISVVSSKNIEIISPTYYEVLTIYTCTGFLDSKRLVLRASPVS